VWPLFRDRKIVARCSGVPATGSIEKRIRLSKPVRIGQFMN
jgi:hypothetical protein